MARLQGKKEKTRKAVFSVTFFIFFHLPASSECSFTPHPFQYLLLSEQTYTLKSRNPSFK